MGTEPIIAPYGALEEKPRLTFSRHLRPDIADGLQFGDHGSVSLRREPKRLADFFQPKAATLMA